MRNQRRVLTLTALLAGCTGGIRPNGSGHEGDQRGDVTPIGRCNAKGTAVVDAQGHALTRCSGEQRCVKAQCISACSAAADERSLAGCEFLVATPPALPTALPPCFAVFVANTSSVPAEISVSYDGSVLDVARFARLVDNSLPPSRWPALTAGVPEEAVAVLFLSSAPNAVMPENGVSLSCPIEPAIDAPTLAVGTATGQAFRIRSNVPVVAHDIMPFGGARSHFPGATMLLPTSIWGRAYVLVATPQGTHSSPGPLWAQLIASEDNTSVRLRPTTPLPAVEGIPASPTDTVTSHLLARAGQIIQWELPQGSGDLSGTAIESDKPIAVVTGNRFFREQPTPSPGGDATHQQLMPADALGHEHLAAPFATRRADLGEETIPYRIVATFDDTRLAYDPPVPGAPSTLSRGEAVDFVATGPFHAQSQDAAHPFALGQIMPTGVVPGGVRPGATAPVPEGFPAALGDEEFTMLVSPEQFAKRYVFFSDPTYATTNLVMVRVRGAEGFRPVTVDCLGTVEGWRAVGQDGVYEITNVDLVRADIGVGRCENGFHVASSQERFGLIVWGLDTYSSYAYPAAGAARKLVSLPSVL